MKSDGTVRTFKEFLESKSQKALIFNQFTCLNMKISNKFENHNPTLNYMLFYTELWCVLFLNEVITRIPKMACYVNFLDSCL